MLEGKAKELFERFWLDHEIENVFLDSIWITKFYQLPLSMQWGVYQDFAESLGYDVSVDAYYQAVDYNHWFFIIYYDKGLEHFKSKLLDTRPEARTAAIKKLNELINQSN